MLAAASVALLAVLALVSCWMYSQISFSIVCHLIGRFVLVVPCCSTACILFIGVGSIDDCFEMRFGKGKVCLGLC